MLGHEEDTQKLTAQKGVKRPHRSQLRRELDRKRIADALLMSDASARQIAARLGLSSSTVRRDLRVLREEWKRERLQDHDAWVARQLQELALTIRESWAGWIRSQEPSKQSKMRSRGLTKKPDPRGGGRVKIKAEDVLEFEQTSKEQTSAGDPRFLEVVERCLASRARLLGLNQPVKVAPTDPTGERPYSDVRAELLRRLDDIAVNVAVPLPGGVGQSGDPTGKARFQRVLPPGSPAAVKEAERQDHTGESGDVEVEVLPPDSEVER